MKPFDHYAPTPVEKDWGEYRVIYLDNYVRAVHAEARRGGQSSLHRHRHEYNEFYVLRGVLQIDVFDDPPRSEPCGSCLVRSNERLVVQRGVWHRFTALEDTSFLEIYWSSLDSSDIERWKGQPAA